MLTQQLRHIKNIDTIDEFEKKIVDSVNPERYAMILHDKDKNVEPHIHCVLSFQNARHITAIAKALGIEPRYIEKWDGSVNNAYGYLLHRTKSSREKYQYDINEVHANFNFIETMNQINEGLYKKQSKKNLNNLLDAYEEDVLSKERLIESLSGHEYARIHHQIKAIDEKKILNKKKLFQMRMKDNNIAIKVIYIYGETATGKTRLARKIAEDTSDSIYISGSNRDVFSFYTSETVVILDELRPKTIPYNELLRILDPYSYDSIAGSRYTDAQLMVELWIITTPYSPKEFYKAALGLNHMSENEIDSFKQFARRLDLVINLTQEYIVHYNYSFEKGRFSTNSKIKNPYSYKETGKPSNSDELFSKLKTTIKREVDNNDKN